MRWTPPSAPPTPAALPISAGDALDFTERGPKPRQVGLGERRKELHQDEMRDALDVARVRGRKAGERRRLVVAREPGFAPRHRDDRAPGVGEREPRQERGGALGAPPPPPPPPPPR